MPQQDPTYTQTIAQIIDDTLMILGRLGAGQTAKPADYNLLLNLCNKMIKGWEAKGIRLWKESEGTLFLLPNVNQYTVGFGSTTITGDSVVESPLTAPASGMNLQVGSTMFMNVGDNVAVALNNNTYGFSTIDSIPSSTQITLTTGIGGSANTGNYVGVYTNSTNRPLEVTSARFRNNASIDRPVEIYGRQSFMEIPDKNTTGPTNTIYFSSQQNTGIFYIWPTPNTVGGNVKFSYTQSIVDLVSSTDIINFPEEWLECITYNLAIRAAPAFGLSLAKLQPEIIQVAAQALMDLQAWDTEKSSVNIVPNYRWDDGSGGYN